MGGPAGHRFVNFDDCIPPFMPEEEAASYALGNVAAVAELKLCTTGGEPERAFTVATTHLAAFPAKDNVRELQAWVLHDVAANFGSGDHVVLCGDLNAEPGSEAHRVLGASRMVSAYRDVEADALTNSNA